MAKIDILDEAMNFLGSKEKDEAHQKGHWHKRFVCG